MPSCKWKATKNRSQIAREKQQNLFAKQNTSNKIRIYKSHKTHKNKAKFHRSVKKNTGRFFLFSQEDSKEKKILLNIVNHENSTTKNGKRAHFFTPNQNEEEKHYEIEKMELFNADL